MGRLWEQLTSNGYTMDEAGHGAVTILVNYIEHVESNLDFVEKQQGVQFTRIAQLEAELKAALALLDIAVPVATLLSINEAEGGIHPDLDTPELEQMRVSITAQLQAMAAGRKYGGSP